MAEPRASSIHPSEAMAEPPASSINPSEAMAEPPASSIHPLEAMADSPASWAGINLRTAENLRFASTPLLLQLYLKCRPFPVSTSIVHSWLMGSYQGSLSPSGMPDGEGSARLFGGLHYVGSFKGGLLHGQGTLAKDNGWSYTGSFSYNNIHGNGVYRWQNEAFYDGQVYQGLPHGDGTLYTGTPECCTYEGSWKHGLRHGQGTLTYGKNNTTKYDGRWALDRKHGCGYHTYDSGTTFQGVWSQGKRNGKGRLLSLCSNQSRSFLYRGELGRLNLCQVYVYEGDWMDDLHSGSGKSLWMRDEKEEMSNKLFNWYVGEFRNGLRHGQGTFYYASGAIYKGEWMDNKKHGKACFIHETGTIFCGEFFNDHIMQNQGCQNLEPFQSLLQNEENFFSIKCGLSNVLSRHNSLLRQIFCKYSQSLKRESCSPSPSALSVPHAIRLEQIWHLCYDGNFVQTGLGLAQIDWLLQPTETSWDSSFEIHKKGRKFIFREFVDFLIILSKIKFADEDCPLDEKVEKMVTNHLVPLVSDESNNRSNILMNVDVMRSVMDGYAPQLQELFTKTLRGIGTSDETISLKAVDLFFLRYRPQWGTQRESLLSALTKGLYLRDLAVGEDGSIYLENDINFTEFEIAIFIYAISMKNQNTELETLVSLNNIIKETIIPNLSTDLESLMNEDVMPNLPNINIKGSNGNSGSKSMPGSKRSTPREGKPVAGGKSAPQTPQRKKR